MKILLKIALSLIALAGASAALAQTPLATYEGADRLDRIVAAAKKEGTLTLYTMIAEKDLQHFGGTDA